MFVKDTTPKGFFLADMYIWWWNPVWGWSQWEDEGFPCQHCIAIPPHYQGSHIGSLDEDLQPYLWNLRAGKEEEMKQIGFITGKLTGRWLQGGGNMWIYITLRWLNTLFRVCMYRRAGTRRIEPISATHKKGIWRESNYTKMMEKTPKTVLGKTGPCLWEMLTVSQRWTDVSGRHVPYFSKISCLCVFGVFMSFQRHERRPKTDLPFSWCLLTIELTLRYANMQGVESVHAIACAHQVGI